MSKKWIGLTVLPALMAGMITSCEPSGNQSEPEGITGGKDTLIENPIPEANLAKADQDSIEEAGAMPGPIEGEFTVEKAMEVVYGLYDREMECSKWVCKAPEKEGFTDKISPDGMVYTRPAANFQIQLEGEPHQLLVTETLERNADGWEDCHACAPILGVALFSEIDNAWFIRSLKKNVESVGSWGKLPEQKLMTLGKENYGIRMEHGYTAQGITVNQMMLVGMVEGKYQVILNQETGFSNEGMYYDDFHPEMAYSYTTAIESQEGENPNWLDLVLTTTGKRPQDMSKPDQNIATFNERKVFSFVKGKYELTEQVLDWQ